jgi:enoyl-CoA hydratase/carnithine racemase
MKSRNKNFVFSGRILDGQQAYDIRLVNEVVKQNEQLDAAYKRSLEIAREIVQQVALNFFEILLIAKGFLPPRDH